MNTETLDKVRLALRDEAPHSASEIIAYSGLSYNTVRAALDELGAVLISTKPRKWNLSDGGLKPLQTLPEVGLPYARRVAVGIKDIDNLVSIWNERRGKLSAAWGNLKVSPNDDPKKLAEDFAAVASTVVALAYTLDQVATKPDWFELAGGKLEDNEVS